MGVLTAPTTYRFDDFLLDTRVRELFRLDARRVPIPVLLGSRAFDVLCLLIERAGGMVSRQEIMDAVWPNITVEEQNLTVQISAVRRVLDEGRAGASCIQTVPGRGYRFLPQIHPSTDTAPAEAKSPAALPGGLEAPPDREPLARAATGLAIRPIAARRWPSLAGWAVALCILIAAVAATTSWLTAGSPATVNRLPRFSIAVLPFKNLSGDAQEDYLADGFTDDLTSDLSHIPQALVIASTSARTFKDRNLDLRSIGRELGVRYLLVGSVRRIGTRLRVNAQLVSTDSGADLWSDRFDQDVSNLTAGQEQILARMRGGLGIGLVEIEAARSRRERPTNPDAFDLILRARWTINQPPSPRRNQEARALFEAALRLDPESVAAMTGLANLLSDQSMSWAGQWLSDGDQQRAAELVAEALRLAPTSELALVAQLHLLHGQLRMGDLLIPAAQLTELYPNNPDGYEYLARGKQNVGRFEEAIPLFEEAIRLNPRDPQIFHRYGYMAFTMMQAGRYDNAATWFARSLAANPDAPPPVRATRYRNMSAALALSGQLDEARKAAEEAQRLWPFDTVRSHFPHDLTNAALVAQELVFRRGLGLAGVRDHADEDAVFDAVADNELHVDLAGYTPSAVLGATTLRTDDVSELLASPRKPIVLDTVMHSWGRSIPGAVGLAGVGLGGSIDDPAQDRLRRKMKVLTGGDLNTPIIAVGWNCERFDGRNLALRLVAMGYTNVLWYRGGREAWEVAGLPETELTASAW
jgi:TolB-like protein/DNA-binding winged helix-turn-helix (wHTH) protein/Tfp pilus assembly protein PilF